MSQISIAVLAAVLFATAFLASARGGPSGGGGSGGDRGGGRTRFGGVQFADDSDENSESSDGKHWNVKSKGKGKGKCATEGVGGGRKDWIDSFLVLVEKKLDSLEEGKVDELEAVLREQEDAFVNVVKECYQGEERQLKKKLRTDQLETWDATKEQCMQDIPTIITSDTNGITECPADDPTEGICCIAKKICDWKVTMVTV